MQDIKYSRSDMMLCRPIIWFTVLSVYCVFGRHLLRPLNILDDYYTFLRYGLSIVLILFALRYVKKRALLYLFALEIFFIISYAYSYLMDYMYQENILLYCITTLAICVPFCILVSSINNLECLYDGLVKASYLNAIVLVVYLFSSWGEVTYSMAASYQVLFCLLIHINEVFRRIRVQKVLIILLVVFEVALIFLRGARGPLLCLSIYLLLKAVTEVRRNKKTIPMILTGCIAIAIVSLNLWTILDWIGRLLAKYSLYSRTFQQIISFSLFEDSGRSQIREKAIELIWQNPFFGYGASSDVKLLGGQYTHSFFLELLIDYGLLVGSVLFGTITILIIKGIFIKEDVQKDLSLIFMILGYVMLFFSASYLQSIYLFLFIGLALRRNLNISGAEKYKQRLVFKNV